jgi:hypothetical protein
VPGSAITGDAGITTCRCRTKAQGSAAPIGEHRRFGKGWFGNKRRELQRRICHHDKLKGFLGNSSSDRAIDAAAIYELLQDLGEDSVNAGVLAVLIARVGLGTFCANAPTA